MSDDRPPLGAFDDETVEAVAAERDHEPGELRDLLVRHQRAVRDLPGVEDVVYEWRSQFHEDPLVHRTPAVYVLSHRPHVWDEYAESLDLTGDELGALRAVHGRQARSLLEPAADSIGDGEPMVLTRP